VSLDTIILQKIVVRNFKQIRKRYWPKNNLENWHYALPVDILKQINLNKSNEKKLEELFELLKEQIDLVNINDSYLRENENYTRTDLRRYFGAKHNIPLVVITQLKEVRDSLMKVDKYQEFIKELPAIENDRLD
jgi:hypothetical protein